MKRDKTFDSRLLAAISTVTLMAPALRLFPRLSAQLAGKGAWLSAIAAAPFLCLFAAFLCRFLSFRKDGEGLAEIIFRVCGTFGKPLLALICLWFLLYSAFILRSGAERLISTVFSYAPPSLFIIIMGMLGIWACLGNVRSIARTAKLIEPVILLVVFVVIISGISSAQREYLLPLTDRNIFPVLKGAVAAVDVASASLYCVCFIYDDVRSAGGSLRYVTVWCLGACIFLCLLCAAIIGSFGADLTGLLAHPFFSLVRNLRLFGSIERVDAFVVALWVFPDFIIFSVFLRSGIRAACLASGLGKPSDGSDKYDLKNGRWLIPAIGVSVIAASLFMAPDEMSLRLLSERIIPISNLIFAFVLLPAVYLCAKIKKRL